MTREIRRRWERANKYAGCRCHIDGSPTEPAGRDDIGYWAGVWEYWNTPDRGHLVMASLALDGVAIEDLP